MAVTEFVTDSRIERTHYEEFFRWHARTLPGYKTLYGQLSGLVDRESTERGCLSFAECTPADRNEIFRRLDAMRHSRFRRMITVAVDREWLLLEAYVVQPVLHLFARTDAWVLLGYPAWPGIARGFEFHLQPKPRQPGSLTAPHDAGEAAHVG